MVLSKQSFLSTIYCVLLTLESVLALHQSTQQALIVIIALNIHFITVTAEDTAGDVAELSVYLESTVGLIQSFASVYFSIYLT